MRDESRRVAHILVYSEMRGGWVEWCQVTVLGRAFAGVERDDVPTCLQCMHDVGKYSVSFETWKIRTVGRRRIP